MSGTASPASQRSHRPSRSYNTGIDSAISDTYELPSCVVSAVELVTYFPHHIKWADIIFRLHRAGWRSPVIARAQLHTRGTLSRAELTRRHNAIRYVKTQRKKSRSARPSFTPESEICATSLNTILIGSSSLVTRLALLASKYHHLTRLSRSISLLTYHNLQGEIWRRLQRPNTGSLRQRSSPPTH